MVVICLLLYIEVKYDMNMQLYYSSTYQMFLQTTQT